MKAYMSPKAYDHGIAPPEDFNPRCDNAGLAPCLSHAALAMNAEREARAILATVKPSADPWPETLGSEWDVSTPIWNLAPWEKHGACYRDLVADLEAFIGEPCQCAQGRHWSPERGYYHCNGILPERN